MRNYFKFKALLLISGLACAFAAKAQWGAIPGTNTEVIGGGQGNTIQRTPDIASTYNAGSSLYAVVWQDQRLTGNYNIYGQCLNSTGNQTWTSGGLLLCGASGAQVAPRIVEGKDGTGCFYVAWEDGRNGASDIFVQKITPSGTLPWGGVWPNGKEIVSACGNQTDIEMLADGNGNIFISWVDNRNGDNDIFIQKIDSSGATQWRYNGVSVCSSNGNQSRQKMALNGSGGVVLVWEDITNGDIYTQNLDANGNIQWTSNGIRVSTYASTQSKPCVVKGVNGGGSTVYYIGWIDSRNGGDVYYVVTSTSGSFGSETAASGITGAAVINLDAISDRNNGVYFAWDGNDASSAYDVYVQRIGTSGSRHSAWPANAVKCCYATGDQTIPKLATCNEEVFVVFGDVSTPSNTDIWYNIIKDINTSAVVKYSGGTPAVLSNKANRQQSYRVTFMDKTAVTAWDDYEFSSSRNIDVFASEMTLSCSTSVTTAMVVKDPATGLNEPAGLQYNGYRIFPNPAYSTLTIVHPVNEDVANVTITGIDGKLVKTINNFHVGSHIDIEGLSPGEYIVKLTDSSANTTFKFVKQ